MKAKEETTKNITIQTNNTNQYEKYYSIFGININNNPLGVIKLFDF